MLKWHLVSYRMKALDCTVNLGSRHVQRALGVVVMTTARQPIGVLVDASVERCLKSTECAAAMLKSARRRVCSSVTGFVQVPESNRRVFEDQGADLQNILRFIVRLSKVYRKIDLR